MQLLNCTSHTEKCVTQQYVINWYAVKRYMSCHITVQSQNSTCQQTYLSQKKPSQNISSPKRYNKNPACPVLSFLFCLSPSVFPVLPVPFCLSCSACPVLSFLFCLSRSVFPVLPVPFCLSYSACSVLSFCSACPVLSFLFCMSVLPTRSGCPILSVLSRLS